MIPKTLPKIATVPEQTVEEGPDGRYVYDTVERRKVELAGGQDGVAMVTKGLQPGDRVVVSGQYRLTNGARVRIAPAVTKSVTG